MNAKHVVSHLLEDEDEVKDLLLDPFDQAVDSMSAEEAYELALDEKRTPVTDCAVLKDPKWAYKYACDIIGGRWPEAEPVIMQDLKWAYYYARNAIQGRWPEAEPVISRSPEWASKYALDVIGGRWPEAEPVIRQDPEWTYYYYARNFIQGRWTDG